MFVLHGVVSTLQASHFGRAYAAYGGFFIALSILQSRGIGGDRTDRAGVLGSQSPRPACT